MDVRLRLGEAHEHPARRFGDRDRKVRAREDGLDVVQVAVGLFRGGLDVDVQRRERPAAHVPHVDGDAFELQPRRQAPQPLDRPAGGDERGERHVAADPGEAVEVGEARHGQALPRALMRCAA